MSNIFENTQQNALTKIQLSEKTRNSFNTWYHNLPKWTEQEIKDEIDDLNYMDENIQYGKGEI